MMMPLLLAAAQLLAGDLYIHDADQNARAIIAQTHLGHSTRDKSLWTELAGQIAADISRAQHHLVKAAPPELTQRLREAERANLKLQASLAVENHAEVRQQAESVLAQLMLAREALRSAEQAAGVIALDRIQPPLRQPVRGVEPRSPEPPPTKNPPPVPPNAATPPPEQPGNVTQPPPAIPPPR